jgi:hypothetical protein
MTKLQNSIENPHFLQEAGEYLEANGYIKKEGSLVNGTIYFFKGDKGVVVYNDNVDFVIYDDGEPDQRRSGYTRYMQVTGISDLDLFKWMLLFHITDIVPMSQFIGRARKELSGDVAALNGVFVQLFDHFRVGENHNSVPVNY